MGLKDRVIAFENWVSSDFQISNPQIFQRELLKLFSENKEAYSYYRSWLYSYLLPEKESNELNEVIDFLESNYGSEGQEIIVQHYSDAEYVRIFSNKRINAFETALIAEETKLSQSHCFLYQQYYEIETALLVLASFIVLNEEEKVDVTHNRFKDKSGKIKKGVLIDFVKSKIKRYKHMYSLLSVGYNSKIRNLIGHNDYRIVNDEIISNDGKTRITKNALFQALYSVQALNNYLLHFFALKNVNYTNFKSEGVLGVSFDLVGGIPRLSIVQLLCFYKHGPYPMPDTIIFSKNGQSMNTDIGYHSPMTGETIELVRLGWFDALKKQSDLRVRVIPIVPRDQEAEYITLDVGEFVLLANEQEYIVKFQLNFD